MTKETKKEKRKGHLSLCKRKRKRGRLRERACLSKEKKEGAPDQGYEGEYGGKSAYPKTDVIWTGASNCPKSEDGSRGGKKGKRTR